MSNKWNPL
jgi:hypothetical protein